MANRFLNNISINDQYTLPASDGSANQVLATNGSGQLSFVDQSEGTSLSGGAANKLAIWSGTDALTNDTNLHWDTTNDRLGIGTATPATTLHVNGRAVIGSSNTIGGAFITSTNIIGSNNDTANTGITTNTSVILGDGNGGRYGNVVISERTLKLGTDDDVSSSSSNTTAILDINNSWRASFQYVNVGGFLGYFPPPTSSNEYLFFSANSLNSLSTSTFSAGNAPEAAKLEMEFNPNFGTNSAGNASNALILNAQGNASSAGALYLTASQNNTTSSRGIVTFDLRHRNNNYEPPDGMKMFEITGGWGRTKFVVESGGQNNEASIGIQKDIYHLGDTDTFFSFTAADTFGVTTGGTERLSIGNSGATFSSPVTFSSSISVNGTSTFSDPATFDSDLTLDGISSMTETTALVMNGGNEVGYRTLGSNAFNSTTIPTNNNQLTNGAGYLTAHPNISAATSSNNSGNTFIQDITLDSNGHVTGLATGSVSGFASSSHTHAASDITSGTLATARLPEFIEEKYIFTSNDSNAVYMPMVKGGMYATSSSSITGQILIKVPSYKTNMMMQFYVDIYEYDTGESLTFRISGYNNNDTNATWYNCSVVNLSDDTDRDFVVRFGADTSNSFQYVAIGETNSTWSYPQVNVRDFYGGYATSESDAQGSFDVSFVTTTPGSVSRTHTGNYVAGDYNNLKNTPTIPTNNNQLTNGAGYITSFTNYYLDGITKSGNTLTFSVNGTTNQTYTFGSNAFNSTTIPTNNNQLTNGAGYTTNTGDITAVTAGDYLSGGATSGSATLNLDVGASGDWWGKGVAVRSDGVMEVGKYIDFHDADAGTTDYDFRITSTSGRLYFSGDLEVDGGDIYINDGNTRITEGSSNSLRAQTNSGYIDIGPQNTSHCHIRTDRSNFYFDKELQVNTGVVRSYDEDLNLNRAGSTAHRLRITSGATISDQPVKIESTASYPKLTIGDTDSTSNTQSGASLEMGNRASNGLTGGSTINLINGSFSQGSIQFRHGSTSTLADPRTMVSSGYTGSSSDYELKFTHYNGSTVDNYTSMRADYSYFNKPIRIGANASANEFDDYEEGTYNLKWSLGGTNTSIYEVTTSNFGSYAANSSKYVKIGRVVHIFLDFDFSAHPSNWASSGSYVYLTNLPFSPLQGSVGGNFSMQWNSDLSSTEQVKDYGGAGHFGQHATLNNNLIQLGVSGRYTPGYYSYWSNTWSLLATDFPGPPPGGANSMVGHITYYTNA